MNKDISNNIFSPFSAAFQGGCHTKPHGLTSQNFDCETREDKSSDCFYAMGCAKVNMDRRTQDAVHYFQKNSERAGAYISFCDNLVERGSSLEDAVMVSDGVFESLSKKETYN